MQSRPDKDYYFLSIAEAVSQRASCFRRKVGCVLVDSIGHILSTGYNGPPRSTPNCSLYNPCPEMDAPRGVSLDKCRAVHAEQNALIQCPKSEAIDVAYITVSPCIHCIKMLLNTSAKRMVFSETYLDEPLKVWVACGRFFTEISKLKQL